MIDIHHLFAICAYSNSVILPRHAKRTHYTPISHGFKGSASAPSSSPGNILFYTTSPRLNWPSTTSISSSFYRAHSNSYYRDRTSSWSATSTPATSRSTTSSDTFPLNTDCTPIVGAFSRRHRSVAAAVGHSHLQHTVNQDREPCRLESFYDLHINVSPEYVIC